MKRWLDKVPARWLLVTFFAGLCVWALLLFGITKAIAGEGTLTWTAPTQRCDGSPLTNLAGYSLTYGQAKQELPLTPLTYTVRGLAPGTWWFSLAAVDAAGERSEFVTVSKVIEPAAFVTTAADVFTVVKRTDRFVMLKVGTAPIGTQCIADQTVNGLYAVPRAAVTWSALIRPDVVVAACG